MIGSADEADYAASTMQVTVPHRRTQGRAQPALSVRLGEKVRALLRAVALVQPRYGFRFTTDRLRPGRVSRRLWPCGCRAQERSLTPRPAPRHTIADMRQIPGAQRLAARSVNQRPAPTTKEDWIARYLPAIQPASTNAFVLRCCALQWRQPFAARRGPPVFCRV